MVPPAPWYALSAKVLIPSLVSASDLGRLLSYREPSAISTRFSLPGPSCSIRLEWLSDRISPIR